MEAFDTMLQAVMEQFNTSSAGLAAAYLVVCGLIAVMSVVCLVLSVRVWLKYSRANKKGISSQMTGIDAARFVLDHYGLNHVTVRKAGFLREMFFGNYYNIWTKTIYLRSWLGKIDSKKSVTSVALGVQKAAVAKLCEDGDKQARTRNSLSLIGIFGPILFLPVVLIGAVIDVMVMKDITVISYVSMAVGGLLLIAGFIVTMLNIPVEKRANKLALQMIEESGLANGEELEMIKEVYDAYILQYIAEFILEVLRVVQWCLEIAMKLNENNKS